MFTPRPSSVTRTRCSSVKVADSCLHRVAVSNAAECLESEKNTDTGSYDVTRVWSVLFWQTVYVAGVPLMMVSSEHNDDDDDDADDDDDDDDADDDDDDDEASW